MCLKIWLNSSEADESATIPADKGSFPAACGVSLPLYIPHCSAAGEFIVKVGEICKVYTHAFAH